MNAIKTFRDLISFLTIIPLAKTEEFVVTSAKYMFLFPAVGALIGFFAATYHEISVFLVSWVLSFFSSLFIIQGDLILKVAVSAMTLAFILVLTGFQHFDGLVDLGNAIGLRGLEERRTVAHDWIVTYKGAFLAIFVEFLAFLGLFFINLDFVFKALIASEVAAKLAMVTIAWIGKPAHKGLGSLFIGNVENRRRNIIAYLISFLILFPLLGLASIWIVLLSFLWGVFMERVSRSVFGGVSGDMIGATNETARAVTLVLMASGLIL
ncbi:adenosylcobinamide-GDP ribazoletransferase [Candidatus Bathyarchaeota archaeon]|nr:adenosylcobinamide-GDP ribazoletransferase [Candidatus Bathyarchaeota archaeon]